MSAVEQASIRNAIQSVELIVSKDGQGGQEGSARKEVEKVMASFVGLSASTSLKLATAKKEKAEVTEKLPSTTAPEGAFKPTTSSAPSSMTPSFGRYLTFYWSTLRGDPTDLKDISLPVFAVFLVFDSHSVVFVSYSCLNASFLCLFIYIYIYIVFLTFFALKRDITNQKKNIQEVSQDAKKKKVSTLLKKDAVDSVTAAPLSLEQRLKHRIVIQKFSSSLLNQRKDTTDKVGFGIFCDDEETKPSSKKRKANDDKSEGQKKKKQMAKKKRRISSSDSESDADGLDAEWTPAGASDSEEEDQPQKKKKKRKSRPKVGRKSIFSLFFLCCCHLNASTVLLINLFPVLLFTSS